MRKKQIIITSNKQKHIITIDDIVFIKALNIYALIHLQNGVVLKSSETISNIEQQINNSSFYRNHRSFLVNMSFISLYKKIDKKIVIKYYDTELPIARDKIKDFEKILYALFLVKK